jgi:hypothetical protein
MPRALAALAQTPAKPELFSIIDPTFLGRLLDHLSCMIMYDHVEERK